MSLPAGFTLDGARRIGEATRAYEAGLLGQGGFTNRAPGGPGLMLAKTPSSLPGGYNGSTALEGTLVELPQGSTSYHTTITAIWIQALNDEALSASTVYHARFAGTLAQSGTTLPYFLVDANDGSATNSGENCLCTWTGSVTGSGAEVTAHTSTGDETWYLSGTIPWLSSLGNGQTISYTSSQMNLGSYVRVIAKRPASGPPYIATTWKMIPFTWPCFLRAPFDWQGGNQGQFFFGEFQLKSPTGSSNSPWKPPTQWSFFRCIDPAAITTQPTAIPRDQGAHGIMACTQETGWIPISRTNLHINTTNIYATQATIGFFRASGMGPSMGGNGQFGTSTGGVE